MAKTTTDYTKRSLKVIIKSMEENNRPSITLGKADISVVLPLLKKAVDE
jgi:hypothetical protein